MSLRTAAPATETSLAQFTQTAESLASDVIGAYSTSFGMATRLLGKRHRTHVRNIYALVRVADEIVDGVAREAGLSLSEQIEVLERYVAETHRALRIGYSSDLIVHAFAATARESGIDESLTQPFFDSMKTDLLVAHDSLAVFDSRAHADYVYGSAEVVGLMCLRVFLRQERLDPSAIAELEHGARQLGAAFQNINFLRDLADDTDRLGRSYLGCANTLTSTDRDRWVADIRSQLSAAERVIPMLPRDTRTAVRTALLLFAKLTDRVAAVPVAELYSSRIRVANPVKLTLASSAVLTTMKEGRS